MDVSLCPYTVLLFSSYWTDSIIFFEKDGAHNNKKSRIIPYHIQLAICKDSELNELFGNITIAQGDVVLNIHESLLKKTKDAKTPDSYTNRILKDAINPIL
ncbi:hypothetical protein C1645_837868 [Glomus cerebriforme]|uniref:Histone H2A C-terminal domain-containing protein n=1 Tax=Glomus cerebriforme TaxID=658196 RepID=A0A397S5X9_9GLOM|nr:hypothetical protein C1645_837868 [Glomus cerebriforme]